MERARVVLRIVIDIGEAVYLIFAKRQSRQGCIQVLQLEKIPLIRCSGDDSYCE
jgi:hypothetical protein